MKFASYERALHWEIGTHSNYQQMHLCNEPVNELLLMLFYKIIMIGGELVINVKNTMA